MGTRTKAIIGVLAAAAAVLAISTGALAASLRDTRNERDDLRGQVAALTIERDHQASRVGELEGQVSAFGTRTTKLDSDLKAAQGCIAGVQKSNDNYLKLLVWAGTLVSEGRSDSTQFHAAYDRAQDNMTAANDRCKPYGGFLGS
jgi:hypothetical protein